MKRPSACLVAAFVSACGHAHTRGRDLDPAALAAQIEKAHAVPESLTAQGKAFVDAPQNGGRYPFQLSVKRPSSLRIAALDPLGNPAAVLVADGGRFALLDARAHKFFRGPATAENLARLIPRPSATRSWWRFSSGSASAPGQRSHRRLRERRRRVLVLDAPGGLSHVICAASDLRIERVRRLRGKDLWWSAALEDHDDQGGAQMPRLIHFSIPGEKTEVELTLRDRLIGKPPPFAAFQLGAPPGVEVVELH